MNPNTGEIHSVGETVIPLPSYLKWKNGGVPCDMLTGACSCGATHTAEERIGHLNDLCDEDLLKNGERASALAAGKGEGRMRIVSLGSGVDPDLAENLAAEACILIVGTEDEIAEVGRGRAGD